MQTSGAFENSTLAAVATWFNLIATLPLCQFTCQHLLLLACSLSLENVVMPELQVDPPGRALSSPFLCPGEAAGGGEWEEMPGGGGGGQTEPSCWLFYPSRHPPPFLPLASCFFMNMCIPIQMCKRLHTHMQTNACSKARAFFVFSLFLTGKQRPAVSDGGDLPFRVSC